MGSIFGTIVALAFLAAIVYFVVKEFKEDSDNTVQMPKKYRNIFVIMGIIFLLIIAVLVYNNFIAVHYNN